MVDRIITRALAEKKTEGGRRREREGRCVPLVAALVVAPEEQGLGEEHHGDGDGADGDQDPLEVELAGEEIVDGLELEGLEEHADHEVEQVGGVLGRRELVAPLEEDEEHHVAEDGLCLGAQAKRQYKADYGGEERGQGHTIMKQSWGTNSNQML